MALDANLSALESALSVDISEIVDLPDYVTPPPGLYKARIKEVGESMMNEKLSLRVVMEILETVELADPTGDADNVVAPGSLTTMSNFFTDKTDLPTALGVLKKQFGHFGANFGTTNLIEILKKLPGSEVTVTITNRVDNVDKTKVYAGFRNFNLA